MSGIEVAILSLALKAIYEITVLSRSLDSVPSSLRRSIQLVQTCYADLEDLIELRNLSIPVLRRDSAWLRRVDSVIEDAQHGLVDVCKLVERVGPKCGKGVLRTRLEWMMKEATEFQAWEGVIAALHRRVLGEMGALRAAGLVGHLGFGDSGGSVGGNVGLDEENVGSGKGTVREWDDVGLLEDMFGAKARGSGNAGGGTGGCMLPPLPEQPLPYDFHDFRLGASLGDMTEMPVTEATQTAYGSEISTGLALIPDGPKTTDWSQGLSTAGGSGVAQTTAFLRHVGDISDASDSVRNLNPESTRCVSEMQNPTCTGELSLHAVPSGDKGVVSPARRIYSKRSEASLSILSLDAEASHNASAPRALPPDDASSIFTRGPTSSSITSISDFDGMDLLFGQLNFYTVTEAIGLPSQPIHPKEPPELPSHQPDSLRDFSCPTSLQRPGELACTSRKEEQIPRSVPHTSNNMVADVYELPDGETL